MTIRLKSIAPAALLVFSALLPLKGGSLVMPDAIPIFQEDFLGYVLGVWPRSWFYLGSALLLGLCLPAFSGVRRSVASGWFVVLFMLLAALSCLGGINSTRGGYVVEMLTYILALAAYFESVSLYLASDPKARQRLIGAWSVGILLVLAVAAYQYIWGFDDMLAYLREQRDKGMAVSAVLEAKIADRRTHAPFDLSNSLGGFLLLALPVLAAGMWRFCAGFEPPKLSQRLVVPVIVLCGFAVFLTTRSRAAFLALALALTVGAVLRLRSRWLRVALVALVIAAIAGGTLLMLRSSRGMKSVRSRTDYHSVAVDTMTDHPLIGAGWGEFYYEYMQNKSDGTEESPRSPHNVILAFGSQAGVLAMLALAAVMLWPFAVLAVRARRGRIDGETALLAIGLAAISLHSLADVNDIVPASAALWGAVSLMVVSGGAPSAPSRSRGVGAYLLLAAVLTLSVLNFECSRRLAQLEGYTGMSSARIVELADAAARLGAEPAYTLAASKLKYFDAAAADKMLDRAAELAPRDPGPWVEKMQIYQRRGRSDAAEAALSEARARFPNNWLLVGSASAVMKNLDSSRSLE